MGNQADCSNQPYTRQLVAVELRDYAALYLPHLDLRGLPHPVDFCAYHSRPKVAPGPTRFPDNPSSVSRATLPSTGRSSHLRRFVACG